MIMVLIRAAESKDIPALKTLFLQLGYQTETAILEQRITEPQSMMIRWWLKQKTPCVA
jgi:hypothetical protein